MKPTRVWTKVYIAALPVYGLDKAAKIANTAVEEFNKTFGEKLTPSEAAVIKATEGKPAEVKLAPVQSSAK